MCQTRGAPCEPDTKRREPWLFGEESTNLIRDAIRRRYGRESPVFRKFANFTKIYQIYRSVDTS